MQPTHGGQHWIEQPGSGVASAVSRGYLRYIGGVWTIVFTGPADGEFVDLLENGTYEAIDLRTPYYLVTSGSDLVISATGPATAILVDDGHGGCTPSTDLTQTPIADLYADLTGTLRIVPRADAISILGFGGNAVLVP